MTHMERGSHQSCVGPCDSSAGSALPVPAVPRAVGQSCFGTVGPHLNQSPGKPMHWPASAAWPTQLNGEEKMLGQQQQACLPAKDIAANDTFASHANPSGVPWRWGMMDVIIPCTSRFAFSFIFFNSIFFNKHCLFAICIFRNHLHCSGPVHWLCKTRFKLKLNTMQCGAFSKALKFLLLLSSKMLTAYLAGLWTAEFCLPVCERFVFAGKTRNCGK